MTTVADPVWTCRLGTDNSFSPLATEAKDWFNVETELDMNFEEQHCIHRGFSDWTDWQDCQLIRTCDGSETAVKASVCLRLILSRSAPGVPSTFDSVAKVRVARPSGLLSAIHHQHPPAWEDILDKVTSGPTTFDAALCIVRDVLSQRDIPLSTNGYVVPPDAIPFTATLSNGERKSILDVDKDRVASFGPTVTAAAITGGMTDIKSGSIPITLSGLEVSYPNTHGGLSLWKEAAELRSWKPRDLTLNYELEVELK